LDQPEWAGADCHALVQATAVVLYRLPANHKAGRVGQHPEEVAAWPIQSDLDRIRIDDSDAGSILPLARRQLRRAEDSIEVITSNGRLRLRPQRPLQAVFHIGRGAHSPVVELSRRVQVE